MIVDIFEIKKLKEYPKSISQIMKKQKILTENLPHSRKRTLEDTKMSIVNELTNLCSKSSDDSRNFVTFERKKERYSRKSESATFVDLFQNIVEMLNMLIDEGYISKEDVIKKIGYIYDNFPLSVNKNPFFEKKKNINFFNDLIKEFAKINFNSKKELVKDFEKFLFNFFNYAEIIKIEKSVINICFQKKFLRYVRKYKIIEKFDEEE